MRLIQKLQAKRNPVASKPSKYLELLTTDESVSLLQHQIKSIRIDCCFHFSKTQWGHIDNIHAGMMYIDLTIHQPQDCRLARFSATVALVPIDSAIAGPVTATQTPPAPTAGTGTATGTGAGAGNGNGKSDTPEAKPLSKPSPSGLIVTDYFGPQAIYGRAQEVSYSRKYEVNPNIGAGGATVSGIGYENNKDSTLSTRWKFEGIRMTANENTASAATGEEATSDQNQPGKYQRVLWILEENKQEAQVFRSPTLHTAFAFKHENKPFLLEIEIEGKLMHRHEMLKFRQKNHQASARAWIDAAKLSDGIDQDLKPAALVLNDTMSEQNCEGQGIEVSGPKQVEQIAKEPIVQQSDTTTKSKSSKNEETIYTYSSPPVDDYDDMINLARQRLNLNDDQTGTNSGIVPNGTAVSETKPEPQVTHANLSAKSISGVDHANDALGFSVNRYISLYLALIVAWLSAVQKKLDQ